jgi:hypothetical protein
VGWEVHLLLQHQESKGITICYWCLSHNVMVGWFVFLVDLYYYTAAKYMTKSDEDVLQATLEELERLFPEEIRADGSPGFAKVVKFTVVRTPTSVYETLPGCEAHRPTQISPISNFFVAGDFSKQKFLASMEGAILSGQLAAKVVSESFLSANTKTAPPRQLSERPPDSSADDINHRTPDRTMYQVRVASSIPQPILAELEQQQQGEPQPITTPV